MGKSYESFCLCFMQSFYIISSLISLQTNIPNTIHSHKTEVFNNTGYFYPVPTPGVITFNYVTSYIEIF